MNFLLILTLLFSCPDKQSNHHMAYIYNPLFKVNQPIKSENQVPCFTALSRDVTLGSYKGNIGKKMKVKFNLINKNGKISGFYYYENIGIDIEIIGEVFDNNLLAYELNSKNDTVAILEGIISESSINGTWINAKTRKEYPLTLSKIAKTTNPLPDNIVGKYHDDMCSLSLKISKSEGDYYYDYTSHKRKLQGKVTFSRSEDLYIILEDIPFAEDYFDISLQEADKKKEQEFERLKKIGKRRVGIECYYSPEEIIIQNYGNSMNYYVKLYDCGEKYIHLIKQ